MTNSTPKRQPIPFGKYLLLDRVNIGGMAEVWRGKSFGAGGFERLVAIKRILPNIAEDEEFVHQVVSRHAEETASPLAEQLLGDWTTTLGRLSKIMPKDFKRVLAAKAAAERDGRNLDEAIMEAAHG